MGLTSDYENLDITTENAQDGNRCKAIIQEETMYYVLSGEKLTLEGTNEYGDKDSPSTKCQKSFWMADEWVEVMETSCPQAVLADVFLNQKRVKICEHSVKTAPREFQISAGGTS